MTPIPDAIAARWAKMWPKDAFLPRPWWSRYDMTYRRCDGITILPATLMRMSANPDERGLWDGKEPYDEAMARIDAAHPLPAPVPMASQVWAWDEKNESTIVDVRHGQPMWNGGGYPYAFQQVVQDRIDEVDRLAREARKPPGSHTNYGSVLFQRCWTDEDMRVWPPPGAFLVYGPSQYGVVPWGPA